jgi:mono/diheme cytochrome c family protein
MPSFEQALSNDERWAAVYYIISLTSNSQSIAAGQELFGANCVSCHGETGKGDGPEAASLAPKPSDFSDRAAMAAKSNQDLFDAIANGKGKMPAWKNKLTETNRWLIVDYIRSLSLAGIPIEATNGIIEGEVKNGTSGADAAKLASLTATLYTVENNIAQPAATATTDAQGKFRFEKLAIGPEHGYGVVVRYGEIDYPSTLLQFEPGKTTLTTSIIVYEMTASDADIGEMSTHLIMNINAGVFQIIELHVIQNKGDKTYLPAVGEGMRFFLPTGAADLSFDDPNIEQGAAKTADGFSARFAVSPSGYQLLFSYTIPFKPPSYSLSYKMPLPTAAFNALILDVGEQAKSDQLTASEPRETTRGRYLNLNGGPFDKGAQVNIDLTSIPTEATPSQPTAVPTAVPRAAMPEYAPWLVLAIAALGAALAVGYSLLRRRRRATAVEEPTPSVVEGPPVEPTEEEQGD